MTGKPGTGPDEQERAEPGDSATNPAGKSSEAPAEGADDAPAGDSGSPEG